MTAVTVFVAPETLNPRFKVLPQSSTPGEGPRYHRFTSPSSSTPISVANVASQGNLECQLLVARQALFHHRLDNPLQGITHEPYWPIEPLYDPLDVVCGEKVR